MILVTNDPFVYLKWVGIFLAIVLISPLVVSGVRHLWFWLHWLTTKPPAHFAEDDFLILRNGHYAKVHLVQKENILVLQDPYAMWSTYKLVRPDETRNGKTW